MRIILFMCGMMVMGAIGYFVWSSVRPEHHGQPFKGVTPVPLAELVDKPDSHVSQIVRVQGVVNEQCPVTGCWFYLKDGDKKLKIEMGDTTPTLPKRVGKNAVVEGALVKSGDTYEFVGTAVEFK